LCQRAARCIVAAMPLIDQIMPNIQPLPRAFNPLVVALAYDGLCTFEFACGAEVFGLARPEYQPDGYRFETCAQHGLPVHGQHGLAMTVDGGLERLAEAGTILIPGWSAFDAPVAPELIAALQTAYARGARLLSICSGAFVLAATGLLDGKRATTHWRYSAALQSRYPRIQVDDDVLYVDEGRILTSAGSAAGLDLCLYLVRRDFGPQIANQVARRLVIAPHRDGGQAQFLERPVAPSGHGSLSGLMDHMRQRLNEPWYVAMLADIAAMSPRTFIRRFKAQSGMTPLDWLTNLRIDQARQLLESSTVSIERIAANCGFGSAMTLRHHFRRKLGVSPSDYRQRFGAD